MVHRLHSLLFCTLVLIPACGGDKTFDGRDRRAPQVVSVVPADGAVDVPTDSEITVVYDEALRTQDFDLTSFQVVDADGNLADGYLALNNDQLLFRPGQPFAYSTLYTVKLTNNVRDLFGNRGKPFQATFTTVPDREPPNSPYNLSYSPLTNLATAIISGAKDPGTTVKFNGVAVAAPAASAIFEVTVPLPLEGANVFTLLAIDAAGNESDLTHISITRDQIAPVGLSLCAGNSGLVWHDQGRDGCWVPQGTHPAPVYWSNPHLHIGSVWNPGDGEVAFVRLGNEERTFGSAAFELDLLANGIPTGPVALRIGARDLAGNETIALARTFVHDDVPPTLYPNFNASALAVTRVTTGSLQFTKGNAPFAEAISFFATLDGIPAGSCAAGTCTIPYTDLDDGAHRFFIAATDAAGNTTTLLNTLRIDTVTPEAIVVPRTGSTTGLSPTLHVFTQEPVTASSLTLTGASPRSLDPLEDPTTSRQHWSFATTGLNAGAQTATVTLRDAAGNVTNVTWSFNSAAADADAVTAAGFAGPITSGARNGTFTLTGLPITAAANVVVFQKNNTGAALELVASASTTLTATTEPLSLFAGTLYTYNADGDFTTLTLPASAWNHSPTTEVTFYSDHFLSAVVPFPYYGTAVSFATGNTVGFNLITDDGYWFRLQNDGYSKLTTDSPTCTVSILPPLVLDASNALAGIQHCDGTYSVDRLDFDTHTRSPAWTSTEGTAVRFGTAIAGGDFFGDGEHTIAIGAPGGAGKVYLYANAASDAPKLILQPHPDIANNRFGSGLAIALNHRPGTASLAAIRAPTSGAASSPGVYFYDGASLASALDPASTQPLISYRTLAALPTNQNCTGGLPLRHEVISPGDVDDDGSEDFVVASWDDSCTGALNPYLPYKTSIRIFLGGPGASDNNPIVIDQTFYRRYRTVGLLETRLIPFGDLNGDGLADFGYVDAPSNGLIRVFYGERSGPPTQRLLNPFETFPTESFALNGVMQADGDGLPGFILSKYYDLPGCGNNFCPTGPGLKLMIWP